MKIKFRCEAWGNVVVFQILEMDERFRNKDDDTTQHFKLDNYITVYSQYGPQITKEKIFLRGYELHRDYNVSTLTFNSEEEAIQYKETLLYILKQWAENWPGWEKEEIQITDNENHIYEF